MMIKVDYKGKSYSAWVRKSGTINYNGTIYTSPTLAGNAVKGSKCNGWWFWKYKNNKGEWVVLDELRRK